VVVSPAAMAALAVAAARAARTAPAATVALGARPASTVVPPELPSPRTPAVAVAALVSAERSLPAAAPSRL